MSNAPKKNEDSAKEVAVVKKKEECLCLQFISENSVGVGYRRWIAEDTNLTIGKIVTTKWPKSTEVAEPNKMAKKEMQLSSDDWGYCEAKILAIGDWLKMCTSVQNFEKHGIVDVTKEDRKVLSRKRQSKDDKIHRTPTKKSNSEKKKIRRLDKQAAAALENKKKEILLQKIEVDRKINADKKIQGDKKVKAANDFDETSDDQTTDDELSIKNSKEYLLGKIRLLQRENKDQRLEIARLRTLDSISKDLPKIEDAFNRLVKLSYAPAAATRKYQEKLKPKITVNHPINVATDGDNDNDNTTFKKSLTQFKINTRAFGNDELHLHSKAFAKKSSPEKKSLNVNLETKIKDSATTFEKSLKQFETTGDVGGDELHANKNNSPEKKSLNVTLETEIKDNATTFEISLKQFETTEDVEGDELHLHSNVFENKNDSSENKSLNVTLETEIEDNADMTFEKSLKQFETTWNVGDDELHLHSNVFENKNDSSENKSSNVVTLETVIKDTAVPETLEQSAATSFNKLNLDLCSKKSLNAFVNDLSSQLITKEEMLTCCISGKLAPAFKSMEENFQKEKQKQKLDEVKLQMIYDCVAQYYSDIPQKQRESLTREVLRNKLSNACKRAAKLAAKERERNATI